MIYRLKEKGEGGEKVGERESEKKKGGGGGGGGKIQ